ncbi:tRNA (cytosine(32)/uridine(32)-2'-O)-methyltransferase TrmJ [Thiogranum longum]|nr:tRNA (cytosine(32)/uridine(32)-2'-O)-methyltransferase TrmJ [Thiogranum longum]
MSENMLQPAVVLIETSHPGNIGATARAMKNMGLRDLRLVNPKQFPCAEATARASGADDVLAAVRQFDSIEAAIAGATLVVGASARSRSLPVPILDPRRCAEQVCTHPDTGRVAILFGRERTGLTNEELDLCHYLVQIPVNPEYPSLNIAAAVQVICYELRVAALAGAGTSQSDIDRDYATSEQMEQFYRHLEQTLVELEFLDPDNPRQLMRRLRRLFNRARPDQNEINILRGILTAANRKAPENSG